MTSTGFFTQLFNQFVALLSALCIGGPTAPVPTALPDPEPPGVVQPVDPVKPVPRNDLLGVVLDTQFNAAVVIGRSIAQSADRFTISVLRVPSDFADAVNRGGVAALPAGAAQSARRLILAAQDSAIGVVQAISDAALSELALVGGSRTTPRADFTAAAAAADIAAPDVAAPDPAAVQRQPLLVRVVQTQVNGAVSIGSSVVGAATDLAAAVVAVPTTVMAAVARGGPTAIPAGLAAAAQRVAVAVRDGATGLIRSVGDAALSELDLIPGGGADTRTAAFVEQPPAMGLVPMLINTAVRLPLAVGVAAADLAVAGVGAAATVTGSVVRAATDVVTAAVNPQSELTVGQALARAPATILGGARDAAGQLQQGVVRARTDFRNTLNPREVATRVSATGGLNTTVIGSDVGTNTAALSSTPSSGNSGSNGSNATGTNAAGVSTGTTTPTTASASASGDNSAESGK